MKITNKEVNLEGTIKDTTGKKLFFTATNEDDTTQIYYFNTKKDLENGVILDEEDVEDIDFLDTQIYPHLA